ncbi:MAG: thioredoxin family protein [Victivallaceae bacterium]|nr:thioredoxin family protein [Victivallaceae bacterium]
MKKLLMMVAVSLGLGLASTVHAGKGWETDFTKAKADAQKSKKIILANFSGSDWCGWCIKLDKEVFSKPEFKKFAKENLVLLMVDFPRNKKKQSKAVQKQNAKLAKKYNIKGFPTILLLDDNGKVLAQTGYQPGGAQAYIKHLKKLMKKK